MPYIYTYTEESSRAGIPLMRPIFLEYAQAAEFYRDDHDFLFGPDLFVSPVVSEMVDVQGVALPPGEWFDYWTSERHTGKDQINLHPRLDEMPLYVRAGAIVPMQPLAAIHFREAKWARSVARLPTHFHVRPGRCVQRLPRALYEDDGHTFAYLKGEILRISYSCQVAPGSVRSHQQC
jgi:alpha-glucosidase